jgi:branched-chain amino acid transport system substrate-binding protein
MTMMAAPQPAPYTIDVILPITGSFAYDGFTDVQTFRVFEAWANAHGGLRGQPIRFEIHDDQSNPALSVQLLTQIQAKHPAAVFGSSSAGICNALAPIAKDGPVLYCFSPAILPPKNGYVFATSISVDPYINAMVRYFRLRGFHRIAIISSSDGSGIADDQSTRRVLEFPEQRDVQVVDWEHFNPTDLTIDAQAANIKRSNAQAIIAWTSGTPFGTVLRSLHDAGVDLPVMTTQANGDPTQLKQYVTFLPTDLTMPGYAYALPTALLPSPEMRKPIADFYQAYKDARMQPSVSKTGSVWDPALIVLTGLRKLGPTATATQLRDYILSLHRFPGVDGTYDFTSGDQHGLSDKAVVLVSWSSASDTWSTRSGPGGIPTTSSVNVVK